MTATMTRACACNNRGLFLHAYIITKGFFNLRHRQPAIYIMANKRNGALYTGVTSDLIKRVYQHKNVSVSGFTKQYDCKQLVYYELRQQMIDAITREKKIKAGSRKKKLSLIEGMNPEWRDLYETLL